ncbi:MAG: septum site-determining protein MinC [Myxococcota bacterium]
MDDTAAGALAPTPDAPPRLPYVLKTVSGGALVLSLTPGTTFDTLRTAIRAGMSATPGRFAGAKLRLDLGARDVDMFDLRRLVHLLKDEFQVDVVGLHCTTEALHRYAEKELKLKVHLQAPMVEEIPPPPPVDPVVEEVPTELVSAPASADDEAAADTGERLLKIDGTVRSGAVVRFAGDVHVFGDVNPGAQIVAGGNVIVFGALKGLAHAGCRGDEHAVIFALDMRPTQLRIGKVIQLPKGDAPERETPHLAPEIASIVGGSIVVEPYKGRLPVPATKEST